MLLVGRNYLHSRTELPLKTGPLFPYESKRVIVLYIGWRNDITVICGHNTISMFRGNTAYRVELSGEDLSRHWNKIKTADLTKCRTITVLLRK